MICSKLKGELKRWDSYGHWCQQKRYLKTWSVWWWRELGTSSILVWLLRTALSWGQINFTLALLNARMFLQWPWHDLGGDSWVHCQGTSEHKGWLIYSRTSIACSDWWPDVTGEDCVGQTAYLESSVQRERRVQIGENIFTSQDFCGPHWWGSMERGDLRQNLTLQEC